MRRRERGVRAEVKSSGREDRKDEKAENSERQIRGTRTGNDMSREVEWAALLQGIRRMRGERG